MVNELVPIRDIGEDEAKVTITHKGEQGDLPDPVYFDSTDGDLLAVAQEAIRAGDVPGIRTDPGADLTGYMIDRYEAVEDLPYNRLAIRPKTAFGR